MPTRTRVGSFGRTFVGECPLSRDGIGMLAEDCESVLTPGSSLRPTATSQTELWRFSPHFHPTTADPRQSPNNYTSLSLYASANLLTSALGFVAYEIVPSGVVSKAEKLRPIPGRRRVCEGVSRLFRLIPCQQRVCEGVSRLFRLIPCQQRVCEGVSRLFRLIPGQRRVCERVSRLFRLIPGQRRVCEGVSRLFRLIPGRRRVYNAFFGTVDEIRSAVQGVIEEISKNPIKVIDRLCMKR